MKPPREIGLVEGPFGFRLWSNETDSEADATYRYALDPPLKPLYPSPLPAHQRREARMIDAKEIAALCERLRTRYRLPPEGMFTPLPIMSEAATALEALQAEVERLKAEREELRREAGELVVAQYATSAKDARIAELEAALEPFAIAAENIGTETPDNRNIWQYPAAMVIEAGHLRRARALLGSKP